MAHTSSIIPSPEQPYFTSYVFYVVMQCTCEHSYYYPSRRQIEIDDLQPEKLIEEIHQITQHIDTSCTKCGRASSPNDARRAVLGVGMPDHSGCILCDFTFDQGDVQRIRFRFDATPDPIQFFRDHPDYFRTRPPDTAPVYLDDALCLEEIGRVLSVRSAWRQVLLDAEEHGAAFLRVDEGHFLFATQEKDGVQVECQMRELASEDFWQFFQKESIPRRRLIGIDRWPLEQRKAAGLDHGIYADWLDPRLAESLREGKLQAIVFSIESVAMQHFANAAAHFQVELNEVFTQDDEESAWWITTASGLSRRFPPLELLQLIAIYKGRVISDQIWLTMERIVKALQKEERVYERFLNRLPPGFSTQWADYGKLMVFRNENPLELLTFAHIADNIDPTDDQALSRLVSWLVSNKTSESLRYVGKRLMSRERFQACYAEMMQEPEAFLFRERKDGLFEIFTDECEHDTIYGLRMVNGDLERAEALFQRDLSLHHYKLRYTTRRSFLRGIQMVALMGRDAASIAAHPALLKGALSKLKIRFGDRVRIFAPFNGILAISALDTDEQKLEKFAYEVARQLPEEPELKSDHLSYHSILELTEDPIGEFKLEAFEHTSRQG